MRGNKDGWNKHTPKQHGLSAGVKFPTTKDGLDAGRVLRDKCPRARHGEAVLGQGKRRDVVGIIEDSNHGRLKNLVPIRHGRMLQSPFAYFRGTACVQAYDLAGTPTSGIDVQCCGDCHLMNFGGFATPERSLAFDINDFDETLRAPFEWDIKRLATSFVIAARWRGFNADQARSAAVGSVKAYRESARQHAETNLLERWYARITIEDLVAVIGKDAELIGRIKKRQAEALRRTNEQVFHKITSTVDGVPRIVDEPPLVYHVDPKYVNAKAIRTIFKDYRETLAEERRILFDRYKVVDVVVKVVGVGSVGTRCAVALFLAGPEDALFLQFKEARRSVLAPYVRQHGSKNGHRIAHNGQRVVIGQRLMQSASDIFLGWTEGPRGRDFYVRQLRDMKVAPAVETMSPRMFGMYAKLCGMALARAHCKAGDAAMIAGYLGTSERFDEAIGDYATAYADQVERDYETFAKAVRSGRLKSELTPSQLETMLR
jgi:uncharacterized protein (DUF2252 family)